MFKWEWKVFIIVLFCFCCMPPLTILAEDEAGTVTFPETGISQDAQEAQPAVSKSNSVEEKKKEQPQVLVAGSVSLPVQGRDSKGVAIEETPQPNAAPVKAVESVEPQGGSITAENVVVGEAAQPVSGQEAQPAANTVIPEQVGKKEDSAKTTGEIRKIAVNEPQNEVTQWVWGEVVTVDPVKKQIAIKYLDYETYDEAVMTLDTNDSTVFDNTAGISEIKPADYVTIDYRKLDNSNLSTLIVVEKKDADADKKEAAVLKDERADVISSGGLAAGQAKLNEDIAASEEKDVEENAVLNEVRGEDDVDSLDDITIPLAPPEAQPDISDFESPPVEDINPQHQQQ